MPGSEPNSVRQVRPQTTTPQRALREMRRADRLEKSGHIVEAIQSLETALDLGADRYTCYLRLTRLYQTQRQWPQAVSAAEKAIVENPVNLAAREAIITCYLESRDFPRVIDASKELLKISPRHIPARDAMGAAYMGMGDFEAAMRVANELIRIDPNNPSHRFTRAHLCQHQGDIRLAIEGFERVIELAPESDMADSARDQLETLDTFQIEQILALAEEDTVFRLRLMVSVEQALMERGYFLSATGNEALSNIASEGFPDLDIPCRTNLYH